jgi:hypothetical protein
MASLLEVLLQHPFVCAAFAFIAYFIILGTYRAYWDSLSSFPGPKIAAATQLYEFYYDVILGGRYTFRIKELHDEYGPIVRISPYELHVADPDFYDSLYTGPRNPRDKWAFLATQFGTPTAFQSTPERELHRKRRAPVNPFFSKRSVTRLEPMIVSKVDKLCAGIQRYKETGKPLSLRFACSALALDVVTQYCFAKPHGSLDQAEFASQWSKAMDPVARLMYINVYFPWFGSMMRNVPPGLAKWLDPMTASLVDFLDVRCPVTVLFSKDEDK